MQLSLFSFGYISCDQYQTCLPVHWLHTNFSTCIGLSTAYFALVQYYIHHPATLLYPILLSHSLLSPSHNWHQFLQPIQIPHCTSTLEPTFPLNSAYSQVLHQCCHSPTFICLRLLYLSPYTPYRLSVPK